MSVFENVMVAAHYGTSSDRKENVNKKAKVNEALEFVGLFDLKDKLAKDLTFYQSRLLEMARALVMNPKILLLDECAAGLNPVEIEEILQKIKKINSQGVTIIIVEHILKFILDLVDRVVVLNFGEKIAEGKPMEVIMNKKVIESYMGAFRLLHVNIEVL